jgi:signal transduction histidine kinase
VRRWPDFWSDPRLVGGLIVAATAGIGLFAERSAYDWNEPREWIPDLIVGVVFAGSAAFALPRDAGTGWLLAATGATWFAGTFDSTFLYLHRGPLVHLLVAYAGWRPRERLLVVCAGVGYVTAFVTDVWADGPTSVALVVGLVAVMTASATRVRGRALAERRTATIAATMFAGAVTAAAVATTPRYVDATLVVYEAVLVGIALLLSARLGAPDTTGVVDVVVELNDSPSGTLRDALASALGDPSVEIGYWSVASTYIDERGRTVVIPTADGDRAATFVERHSQPFAVLVHDRFVVDSPSIADAVATATRLSAANAELGEEVRSQLRALEASRRRLVLAADRERRRLEARLHDGAAGRIAALAEYLAGLPDADLHLARAVRHLERTIVDLDDVARGLHPRELERGLPAALEVVAARCPCPVDLSCDVQGATPNEVAVAAYYVCSEALANVAKHANATRAAVSITSDERRLLLSITDDGSGGADITAGSGLRGLTDRVEALGGRLTVESPHGGPTRLVGEVPFFHNVV